MNIEILKVLMEEKHYSRRKLAKAIGISHQGLNNALISGDFKVSTLEKIAEILDVDMSIFFSQKNNKSKSYQTNKYPYQSTIYNAFRFNFDTIEDDNTWLFLISFARTFEANKTIDKKLQLCENSTFEKVMRHPEFDNKQFKKIEENQFNIYSWQFDNLYKTKKKCKYLSYKEMVDSKDSVARIDFLKFITKDNPYEIPDVMQEEFKEKLNLFLEYLKSFLANLVSENKLFQELALMGLLSKLYTDTEFIENYLSDMYISKVFL